MITTIVILSFICMILLTLLYFSIKANFNASKQLLFYDDFYEGTLEDVHEIIQYVDKLAKRELISQDPDVANLRKSILLLRDLLAGYINVSKVTKNNQVKK